MQDVLTIIEEIADISGVPFQTILATGKRATATVSARRACVVVMRDYREMSFTEIAHAFGAKSHTAALETYNNLDRDEVAQRLVRAVMERIEALDADRLAAERGAK